jgi:hypothetical protein
MACTHRSERPSASFGPHKGEGAKQGVMLGEFAGKLAIVFADRSTLFVLFPQFGR